MSGETKKKTTFRKVEEGMILETEDGEAFAFGLPEEVEKKTEAGGKAGLGLKGIGGEAKGEKYSRVKYKWHIVPGKVTKLTNEQITRMSSSIIKTSGTVPTSYTSYALVNQYKLCEKCGHSNPLEANYCSECGNSLRS